MNNFWMAFLAAQTDAADSKPADRRRRAFSMLAGLGSDEEGTYIFNLVDQNTLDYCYSETGASPRSVCARLTRQR